MKMKAESELWQDMQLDYASLANCRLEGVNLSGSSMKGAVLRGAKLIDCNLDKCDLTGAIVDADTDISGSSFDGARVGEVFGETGEVKRDGTRLKNAFFDVPKGTEEV